MTPTGAVGLGVAEWIDYIDVVIGTSALKADLTTLFDFADLDDSGGEIEMVCAKRLTIIKAHDVSKNVLTMRA